MHRTLSLGPAVAFTRFAALLASITLPLLSHAAITVQTQPAATAPEQVAAALLRERLPMLISEADAAKGVTLSVGVNLLPDLGTATPGTHVVKSTPEGIIISGNTPAATLWAASELCYQLGMRSLLHGDAMPVTPSTLKLDALDLRLSPQQEQRVWRGFTGQAYGLDSWSADDLEKLMAQLAKLKFTHIDIPKWLEPFAVISLEGDVAGRAAFKGAKSFGNPDLAKVLKLAAASAAKHGLGTEPEPDPALYKLMGMTAMPQSYNWPMGNERVVRGPNALTGDLNILAHYYSRAACQPSITHDAALAGLVDPICGEGVTERMAKAIQLQDDAANGILIAFLLRPGILTAHLADRTRVEDWQMAKAKAAVASAMTEMYRANTRARGGARPFILYQAKRLEFALHWLTAIEALRKAADPAQAATKAESLDAALEATYNAINALGDVARDNSDRGLIALLNQYALKPLMDYIEAQ
jgi:hypothetical protein